MMFHVEQRLELLKICTYAYMILHQWNYPLFYLQIVYITAIIFGGQKL